jgi:hypothetical protein
MMHMVTLIAGPHFTLEGPDSFLQSSALPVTVVLWNTDRVFSRWPPLTPRPTVLHSSPSKFQVQIVAPT